MDPSEKETLEKTMRWVEAVRHAGEYYVANQVIELSKSILQREDLSGEDRMGCEREVNHAQQRIAELDEAHGKDIKTIFDYMKETNGDHEKICIDKFYEFVDNKQ